MSGLEKLLDVNLYKTLMPAYMILLFYFAVMFASSTVGYALNKDNGFTYGLVFGVVVSLVLWFQFGRKMAYA